MPSLSNTRYIGFPEQSISVFFHLRTFAHLLPTVWNFFLISICQNPICYSRPSSNATSSMKSSLLTSITLTVLSPKLTAAYHDRSLFFPQIAEQSRCSWLADNSPPWDDVRNTGSCYLLVLPQNPLLSTNKGERGETTLLFFFFLIFI